jgi:hypothetical protein
VTPTREPGHSSVIPTEELHRMRAPRRVIVTPEGDARIDETLATAPPNPCLAPGVLINPAPGGTPATGTYIAASGA